MYEWKRPTLLDVISALFLFLLVREWLIPLQVLTDTGDLWPFYMIAASVILVDLLMPYRWLSFPFKLIGLLWLLHATFFETPFWERKWLIEVYQHIVHDIPLVFAQDWGAMSILSRNAMFDIMLIVLISMITYLVLEQRQVLWFVVMTEAYLALLDTFMPYEADGGIIRTLICGFLLLAITHLTKMTRMATVNGKRGWVLANSIMAPMLIIAMSVGIAYAAPKQDASWPDPISFLMGNSQGTAGTVMKKVGYDNNDGQLGGPFISDNTLVFVGVTNEQSYWRGDSKDIYTGVGWEKGKREYESILDLQNHEWENTLFKGLEAREVKSSLFFSGPLQYATVFYPGQIKKLRDYTPENATVVFDTWNQQLEIRAGKINLLPPSGSSNSQPVVGPNTLLMKLKQYNVESEVPVVSEKAITQAGTNYPEEIRANYLQLPEQLPARVRELAQEITQNAENPYQKVRAIENYLRSSGKYKYETTDVPIPEPGQDFVDQFLFESYRGYCDHFSTSMTVMLRTLDIPARWVKGFAPGERVGSDDQGNDIMEVRSKDAHSWVEVYFPELGWIPFEATSTFTSPVRIQYDLQSEQSQLPIPLPDLGNQGGIDRGDGRWDELEGGDAVSTSGFRIPWQVNALILAALAGSAFVAWRRRQDIQIWWLRRKMNHLESNQYPDRFHLLMRMVESVYTRRKSGETIREYVNRLSIPGDKRQDLRYLTEMYERMIYGLKGMEQKARIVAEELMERLIRQLKP
ncbi:MULTISPECIES: transglutaminase domain-containing protein [Brevibacillus]|uniref:DUF4129 domain-containing transglutaminase family protein n=1 Tax=Brevibacillus TaxID=55080 RepID=UPI002040BD5E|nr:MULTISPECIES: transglutaminase domain-containing protein [Brevibacillus]MCM3081570.1 transglutaminase domain-containing protein [Brevibacillus invocatus]MCM3431945.1 transglutaminase domain-containing protein [Brevibacillus invocatus]MDH4617401.1 transglutaminase domain-containing protein [Brevibacillus sp. AY1]